MKKTIIPVFLLAAMTLAVLSGCSLRAAEERLDAAQDAAEQRVEAMEESAEQALRQAVTPETSPFDAQNPALSVEEAKAAALGHAGLTADQVRFLRAEYEADYPTPRYEIEFQEGQWEYEYEIHAETGEVLSFERDN